MKIARTQNAIRIILFGSLYRIINLTLPFFSRTMILYVLGEQYLGLSSLFGSILSFLSLTELGMGSAMVYSMYKPIAENDYPTICALLNLYRRLYRIIGVIILLLGICLMPFLRQLIHGEIPGDVNIYVLYFIYLLNVVLSYWLFTYKTALLQAYQRNDIESKIGMLIVPVSYLVMLGSLFFFKNYYSYVIWLPVFTIITNIIRKIWVDHMFPDLMPEGNISDTLKKSIMKKVAALFGTKLNTVVLNAADNLVMAAYIGLTVIAIYGNYYYIMSAIIGFLSICYSSMTAGLGNSLETESLQKNYRDFEKFSFINSWLVGWCAVCLVCLYQPFMYIWTGERLMFPFYVVLEFGLYFYIYQIRKIPITYKDAAGIWWEDRYRPYVCMVTNLVLNVMLVQIIGVSGIILSTVLSLFVSIPWENYTIFKYIFHCSSKKYYLKMFYYCFSMIIAGFTTFMVCELFNQGIIYFFIRSIICIAIPNIIFVIMNCKCREFKDTVLFIKGVLKR